MIPLFFHPILCPDETFQELARALSSRESDSSNLRASETQGISPLTTLILKFPSHCFADVWQVVLHILLLIFAYSFVPLNAYTLAELKSVVKDTKSNMKNITKSISIHSDYQGVHFW